MVENVRAPDGSRLFRVDPDYLEGLVGFEKGEVHRPGVSVHAFEENESVHGRYNREIEVMLSSALACPNRSSEGQTATSPNAHVSPPAAVPGHSCDVRVFSFGSDLSEAMHDSLRVLGPGAPIDKTVLCTVDEFWSTTPGTSKCFLPFTSEQLKKDDLKNPDFDKALPKEEAPPKGTFLVWPYYLNVLTGYDLTRPCIPF